MGEAIAHLNFLWRAARLERRVAADGAIRFAAPRPTLCARESQNHVNQD
jgi:hypothetical protein